MTHEELKLMVYEVIQNIANKSDTLIQADTQLGAEGLGIDSVDFLEIVLELERRTGITIRDEQLTADTLATAGNIIRLLEKSC